MERSEPSPVGGGPLGDVAAIQKIAAIPSVLEIICRVTAMRFAAVARVTDDQWICCAVRDEANFGVGPGDELDIRSTICNELRGHREPVVIENVAEDPIYRDYPTPRLHGFQSYIAAPIRRRNGDFFGTLYAIDPKPAKLANSAASTTISLFAEFISLQLDVIGR